MPYPSKKGVKNLLNAGVCSSIIIMLFSATFLWNSTKVDYEGPLGFGPGFFPLWLSIILLVLAVLYLFSSLKEKILMMDILPMGRAFQEFLLIIIAMSLFVFLLEKTGFIIAGTLSLIVLLIRTFKLVYNVVLSIGISVAIFFIFARALQIPLPVNAFGW